jgi:hypothetical protein
VVPTLCLFVLYGSQNKQQLLPYKTLTDWFLQPKWRVFTARYALSPYIKQIRFVFKGLTCHVSSEVLLLKVRYPDVHVTHHPCNCLIHTGLHVKFVPHFLLFTTSICFGHRMWPPQWGTRLHRLIQHTLQAVTRKW